MSIYNKYTYQWESPEGIYAEIKLELKSYFDSGAIDDTLFQAYTDTVLSKIGHSMLEEKYDIIELKNYKAFLPEYIQRLNFVLCISNYKTYTYQSFSKKGSSELKWYLNEDSNSMQNDPICKEVLIFNTETGAESSESFTTFRLVPVDIQSKALTEDHWFKQLFSFDSWYRVNGRILESNIKDGHLCIQYKTRRITDDGYLMIPAEQKFYDLLSNYIKYKLFELLWHRITDESSNQIQAKLIYYKQQYDESLIIARTEFNSKSYNEQLQSINRRQQSFRRKYNL